MKVLLVFVALVVATCALPISEEEFQSQFEDFKIQHGKQYATESEEQYRSEVFRENLIWIAEHNERFKRGEVTYTVGVNQFADMHEHEMAKAVKSQPAPAMGPSHSVHKAPSTPWIWSKTVDWRSKGYISGPKDQMVCGSSWAWSAVGAVEAHVAIKYGKKVVLSAQQLVDCAQNVSQYSVSGCYCFDPEVAFNHIRLLGGIDTEEFYGYTGEEQACHFSRDQAVAGVTEVVKVNPTEMDVMHAVQTAGPVAAVIDASQKSFLMYKNGVYFDDDCRWAPGHGNQAVLVVGFGSNKWWGSNDYWLVKNSWGTTWGENGYMKIARKKHACGITNFASYPVVEILSS